MKFIENIYFDESQNKYIIDHSKGISTIDKENIKHIKYQYAYTNNYWFTFPLVILLIILNFSYRNFSYPNFFEHKLAYILLIIILLIGLILCVEFLRFFRSKFTIYHEKNETFYFNQDTASFNIYGAFESHEINCHRSKPNFDKQNLLLNSFFPIFCLIVPTFLFVGSVQSFSPKLNVLFISDFTFINSLWLTSIILVLIRYRDSALAFIYVPILLFIGFLNIWEKKYTEIVYHQIFTIGIIRSFNLSFREKTTLFSSLVICFIYYILCFTIFDFPKMPFLISTVCLIILFIHRFFYLQQINYSKIENICLYYLNDSQIEDQLILHRNYNALAAITPGYFYYKNDKYFYRNYEIDREQFHLFDNKKWLNEKFEKFNYHQKINDLNPFNLFFPEFINIQYFKKDYLFYLKNVILEEKEELVIIPYFILDEEILLMYVSRGRGKEKSPSIIQLLKRFLNNNKNTLDKLIKKALEYNNEFGNSTFSYLEYASSNLKNDRNFILELVESNGDELEFISNKLQNDKEIVLEAVKSNGNALQYASKELRNNKAFFLETLRTMSCRINEAILKFASEELQNDKEIVLQAVKSNGFNLKHASKELQNDIEIVLQAFRRHPDTLQFASKELQNEFASKEFKNYIDLFLFSPGFIAFKFGDLNFIKDKELQNDRNVVLDIVYRGGNALKFVSKEIQNDKEIVLQAVKSNGHALQYTSEDLRNDKEVVLEAVKSKGQALQYTSEDLQNDKEVVLEAVKSNGDALQYTSEDLRNNKEIVLQAVKSYGYILRYASKDLQNDKEVVLEAVKSDGIALEFASKELQNDKEIVLEAVISNGTALEFASHELKNDKEVVLEAINSTIVVEYYLDVLQFASKELLKDKKIVLEAVKKGRNVEYISDELINDRDFILQVDKFEDVINQIRYKFNNIASKKVKYMLIDKLN